MGIRTDPTAVQKTLLDDYDTVTQPDLNPFIEAASVMVDRVVMDAAQKSATLTSGEQEMIERWLSAHLYACSDQTYASRNTAGASGSFQGQTGQGLQSTKYGQTAMRLDWSNCLRNQDEQQRASVLWLGKVPSEQIPYEQRD